MMRYQWTNEVVFWLFFLCIMHHLTPQTSSWQCLEIFYIAYFLVHSLANSWYLDLSVLYSLKMKDKIITDVWLMYKIWSAVKRRSPGYFWNKRIVRVGVTEQRADWEQHFWDGECWRPLRPGMWCDVNTDRAQSVPWFHLRMSRQIDPLELMLGW